MSKDVTLIDFEMDAPMAVTDLPEYFPAGNAPAIYSQSRDLSDGQFDDVGWGFLKKIWKGAKKVAKKGANFITKNPVARLARRFTPKFIRRGLSTAWKYTKKSILWPTKLVLKITSGAVKWIIRKIIGKGVRKIAARRAKFIAYRRNGSTKPNREQLAEGVRWARKYMKSKGVIGKMYKLAMKKTLQNKGVARAIAQKQRQARMSGERFEVGGAVTAAVTAVAVPIIIALVKKYVGLAGKEGAPADPRQAAPETTYGDQLAQQFGRAATNYFLPPSRPPPPGELMNPFEASMAQPQPYGGPPPAQRYMPAPDPDAYMMPTMLDMPPEETEYSYQPDYSEYSEF